MGTAAFVAFLMSLTDKNYTATQYALLSSVFAIGRTLAGVPAGFLAKNLGWPLYFVICTCLASPGLFLLWWIRRQASAVRLQL
jgi:PAT family beta-lactamase induction signal transducer AmpG